MRVHIVGGDKRCIAAPGNSLKAHQAARIIAPIEKVRGKITGGRCRAGGSSEFFEHDCKGRFHQSFIGPRHMPRLVCHRRRQSDQNLPARMV